MKEKQIQPLPSWMSRTSVEVAPGMTELRTIVYPQVYTGLYSVPGMNSWPWVDANNTEDGILVSIIGGATGLTRIGVLATTPSAQADSTVPLVSADSTIEQSPISTPSLPSISFTPSTRLSVVSQKLPPSTTAPSSNRPSHTPTASPNASRSHFSTSRQPTTVGRSTAIPIFRSSTASSSLNRTPAESTTHINFPTLIPDSRSSISAGVIAAIVIGVAAVTALILLLLGVCIMRKRRKVDSEAGRLNGGALGQPFYGPCRSRESSFIPIHASATHVARKSRRKSCDGQGEQEYLMRYRDEALMPVSADLAPVTAMSDSSGRPIVATHTSGVQTDPRNLRPNYGVSFPTDNKLADKPDADSGAGPSASQQQQPGPSATGFNNGAAGVDGNSYREQDSLFYTPQYGTPSDRRTIALRNPLIGPCRPGQHASIDVNTNAEAGPSRRRGTSYAISTTSRLSSGLARMFSLSTSPRNRSASRAGASFLGDDSDTIGDARHLTAPNSLVYPHSRRDTLDTGTVISSVADDRDYDSAESRNSRLARNLALIDTASALDTLREATSRDEEALATYNSQALPVLRDNPSYRRVTSTTASWMNEELTDLAGHKLEAVPLGNSPLLHDEQEYAIPPESEESRTLLHSGMFLSNGGSGDGTLRAMLPAAAARTEKGKRRTASSLGQPVRRRSGISAMSTFEADTSFSQSLHTARSHNSSKSRSSRSAGSRDDIDISRANSKNSTSPLSIKKKRQPSEGSSSGSISRRSHRSNPSSGDERRLRVCHGAPRREDDSLASEDMSKRSMNKLPDEAPGSWLTGDGLPPLP